MPCPAGSPLSCYVDINCITPTTITGTVYDPAGRNPVYGVVVFVPNDPGQLPAITGGNPSCNACDTQIGDYVSATLTDATGHFNLVDVPTGRNVPLVVQTGKWRRAITVPGTSNCATTTLAEGTIRLPRNRQEGDLPQMALLTGGCDNLACFLRSVGVDASEFSSPHAGGHVDVYQGLGTTGAGAPLSSGSAGDCTTDGCPLWNSTASLAAYDTVLLGCECGENNQTKPAASLTAMHDYLAQGGTVFATHSQATWFKNGPADFQGVANWTDGPASGATGPFAVDTTFVAGNTLRTWLAGIDAGDSAGVVPLVPADVSTSVTTVNVGDGVALDLRRIAGPGRRRRHLGQREGALVSRAPCPSGGRRRGRELLRLGVLHGHPRGGRPGPGGHDRRRRRRAGRVRRRPHDSPGDGAGVSLLLPAKLPAAAGQGPSAPVALRRNVR